MSGGRSIIKLSDSSKVKINMDGAYIAGNMANTNVISIERSEDINISARQMQVVDTRYGHEPKYAPPYHTGPRHRSSSSSSSSSSSDDERYPYPGAHFTSTSSSHSAYVPMVIVNMEVNERRSLATRFPITKTIRDIKNYIRQRSEEHAKHDFFLINKQNRSIEYKDENATISSLNFRDNTRLATVYINRPC